MPKKKSARTPKKSKSVKKISVKSPEARKSKLIFRSIIRPKINISSNILSQFKALLGLILILIGFLFLNTYIDIHFPKTSLNFNVGNKKAANVKAETGPIRIDPTLMKEENVSEQPIRVVMPNANIDINVIEAPVINGYWETSDTTASHGMGSANPGQSGNTVIFAHARVGLFYNLKEIQKDDVVYVFTDKKWYAYKVTDITSVYPDQIEVIAPTKDQRLTLYTCTGYADEKRLIVVAKPIKV